MSGGNPNTNQTPDTVSSPDVKESIETPMRPHHASETSEKKLPPQKQPS